MKRFMFCLLFFLAVFAFGQTDWEIVTDWGHIENLHFPDTAHVLKPHAAETLHIASDNIWSSADGFTLSGDVLLGRTEYGEGSILIYSVNKSGGALTKGLWVEVDDAIVSVVDSVAVTADPETLTVALTCGGEGGYSKISLFPISIGAACSLQVTGVDYVGASACDTIITSTDDANAFSSTVWDSITECVFLGADANDSCQVRAYAVNGFKASTANDPKVLGVVADASIADNAVGKICIYGLVDYAVVDASSTVGLPGMFLEATGSDNYADPNSTPTATGSACGILLEATSAVDTVRAFIVHQ